MASNDSTRKPKYEPELIVALARGLPLREAAAQVDISERTVFRRLQDPEFKRQVQDTRTILLSTVVGQLVEAGTEAASTLVQLLKARSEHVRLGAARAILELTPKMRESEEFANRLAELERLVEEQVQASASTKGGSKWAA